MRTSWLILYCLVSQYPSLCQFHLSEQCLAVPAPASLITLHHTSSQISPSDDEWLKGYIGIIPYYQGQPHTSDFNYYLQNIRGVSFTIQWVTGLKTFVTQQSVHQTISHSPLAEWSLSKTCSLQLSSCAAAAVLQRCQVQTLLGGISRY